MAVDYQALIKSRDEIKRFDDRISRLGYKWDHSINFSIGSTTLSREIVYNKEEDEEPEDCCDQDSYFPYYVEQDYVSLELDYIDKIIDCLPFWADPIKPYIVNAILEREQWRLRLMGKAINFKFDCEVDGVEDKEITK